MLAYEEARVVIGDILNNLGESVAGTIRIAGGEARCRHADVTDEEQCRCELRLRVQGAVLIAVTAQQVFQRRPLPLFFGQPSLQFSPLLPYYT